MTELHRLASAATLLLALPLLLAAQIGRPEAPPRGPAVVLDGRELPVPVTITPGGPLFALRPLVDSLGGQLGGEDTGESYNLKIEATEVVTGIGNAIITVGEEIVSLSQPPVRGQGGPQVPLDFLRKTYGAVSGYSFDWRPEDSRLTISRRESREIKVLLDVVHLQGMTTVVLQFPETPRYRLNQQPGAVEVQLLADRLAPPVRKKVDDSLVQDVTFAPQLVRIQLVPDAEVESYLLDNPFRLVFDVHRKSAAPVPAGPSAATFDLRSSTRTIVVDPGHGGTETGAIGPGGIAEKELTLVLARDLEARLTQRLPVRVVLTRNDDTKLPLDNRTAIANQNKADLFISLHLNSSLGTGAHGAETYFLSSQATDTRAETAAASENVGGQAAAGDAGQENQDLQMLLWDLAQSHHLAESQRFAGLVQAELNQALELKDRGVKQAPFRVLMGAAMPAVLVELGFISNPDEESKLQNPAYRANLVEALVRAVGRYLEPPQAERRSTPPLPPTQGAVRSNPGSPTPP
ncbi:MAG TPA: N-acetylmuramoyl-L-alanine amidase [Thermoanaerobaculia bacterium]|nr:N-acetylmuramoyl-L-alanine amidase [Thermoanaerobaculia bacterium]